MSARARSISPTCCARRTATRRWRPPPTTRACRRCAGSGCCPRRGATSPTSWRCAAASAGSGGGWTSGPPAHRRRPAALRRRPPGAGGGRAGRRPELAEPRDVVALKENSPVPITGPVSPPTPNHLPSPGDPGALARLRGLLEAARAVRAGGDLQPLLEAIARAISVSLGFRSVVINLHRPAWDDFEVAIVHGSEEGRRVLLGPSDTWERWHALL